MNVKTEIGNINATKEVLNEICILCFEASLGYSKRDRQALSQLRERVGQKIFDELEKTGFYED